MTEITSSRVEQLLERIQKLRFAIVGDFCLDAYLHLDLSASEISLETGLPTQPVAEQRYSLGGAGNLANNLSAMGARDVRAFGVHGTDPFAPTLVSLLVKTGVNTSGLKTQNAGWDTHVFTKIILDRQEQPRLDYGNFNELEAETAGLLLADLDRQLPELDILIINQQVLKGIHTTEFRQALSDLIRRHHGRLCISDSRAFSDSFHGTMRKINAHEGALLCGRRYDPQDRVPGQAVEEIAAELYRRWGRPLFITRGSWGAVVYDEGGPTEVPGLLITAPVDPVGAGDSMLAGIAAALAAGSTPVEAAQLGTLVAGVTVQKLFITGTATPEEILALARGAAYRYRPELAALPQRARYLEDTEIEIITAVPESPGFSHAIFDNDGTVSTLRQGWEEVMEPMMVRAILGPASDGADFSTRRRVLERVRDYIDKTTGVQTLVQMKGLAEMVRELGFVPEEEILDEHGYKAIYNRDLMARVNRRLSKIERGELDLQDFTLKNAAAFLKSLFDREVLLYLASGTDQEDVDREARTLGYAHFFAGRIYGAVGDIDHEPKKMVLESILADIERSGGGRIITFGDGPVEIRETRRRGGTAVGVASNEVQRYGLNEAKRSRLIQAGADLIIADFSQMARLISLLFGGSQ